MFYINGVFSLKKNIYWPSKIAYNYKNEEFRPSAALWEFSSDCMRNLKRHINVLPSDIIMCPNVLLTLQTFERIKIYKSNVPIKPHTPTTMTSCAIRINEHIFF